MKNKEKDVIENKITLREKISLKFRKSWIVSRTTTILIVLILLAGYIALNIWTQGLNLPEIDVTENKIYTLSEASKSAIKDIEQNVTIYAYGFEENGSLIKLLNQYSNVSDKIKYEIINEETNYSMVQEHDLREGYYILILKSGDSEKVIDGSTDFSTYDYTTGQSVDTTEQVITNSILSLNEANKPKVYFLQGHGEFDVSNENGTINSTSLGVLVTYLQNEAFEVDTLNLMTSGNVPEDCNVLAIMSPTTDFMESETQAIKDYINKGGNIYFSLDVVSETTSLPNLQSVLDEYGVSVQNGYILEYGEDQSMSNYPYIFMPQVSSTNKITGDIYTDSFMWLVYSARLNVKDDDTLKALNVEKETLLSSTEDSMFITDLSKDITTAMQTGEQGSSEISSLFTKTMTSTNENGESIEKQSKLVISASGSFVSDYQISALSQNYPLSYLGSNKDFVINAMSYLGDKENILTIRKDMANSTYTPTEAQNRVVITLVFSVPIIIIFIGIMVGVYRKKRK